MSSSKRQLAPKLVPTRYGSWRHCCRLRWNLPSIRTGVEL